MFASRTTFYLLRFHLQHALEKLKYEVFEASVRMLVKCLTPELHPLGFSMFYFDMWPHHVSQAGFEFTQ